MAKLLLIEPERLLADTYAAALTAAGHEVRHAATAQAAIHSADEVIPDLVLLELQLARHDGVEFLHEFRSYQEWQAIPVIVHSFMVPGELALAEPALRQRLGVGAVLYKPRTALKQLLSAIADQLEPAR